MVGGWGENHRRSFASHRLRKIFKRYDLDGDGTIDRAELGRAFADAHQHPSEKQIDLLFWKFDADGNGSLDFEEFKAFIQHIESELKADQELEARNLMRSASVISRRETLEEPEKIFETSKEPGSQGHAKGGPASS